MYLNIKEAMAFGGLTRMQILRAAEKGELSVRIFGKTTLYSGHDLLSISRQLSAKRKQTPAAPPQNGFNTRARIEQILAEKGRRLSGGRY